METDPPQESLEMDAAALTNTIPAALRESLSRRTQVRPPTETETTNVCCCKVRSSRAISYAAIVDAFQTENSLFL